jgi:mannose-6-phosphate isomerase-like protein (cupin superfamily)
MRSRLTALRFACCAPYRAAAWPPSGWVPNAVSKAVAHRRVEEIWYFTAGYGRMWRKLGNREEITEVAPGVSITLPTGTQFQFRSDGSEPLEAVAVTMPPWPGADEAFVVPGRWEPTV